MVNIVFINFHTTAADRRYFEDSWAHSELPAKLRRGTDRLWLVDLGPTVNSKNSVGVIDQPGGTWRTVHSLNSTRAHSTRAHSTRAHRSRSSTTSMRARHQWVAKLRAAVRFLRNSLRRVDLLVYGGHGGGIVLGLWGSTSSPLMSIVDFAVSVGPLSPRIVAFDACYMGQVLPLYELAVVVPACKYIVASPSYSNSFKNVNITESKSIEQFIGYRNRPLDWFKLLLRERRDRVAQRTYDCIVVYATAPMRSMVARIDRLAATGEMYFTTDAIVYRNETNLLDLATVARQDPKLVAIMDRVVAPTAGYGVCPRTMGITIEQDSWFRYRNEYRRSKLWRAAPNLFNKPWLRESHALITRSSRSRTKAPPAP